MNKLRRHWFLVLIGLIFVGGLAFGQWRHHRRETACARLQERCTQQWADMGHEEKWGCVTLRINRKTIDENYREDGYTEAEMCEEFHDKLDKLREEDRQ